MPCLALINPDFKFSKARIKVGLFLAFALFLLYSVSDRDSGNSPAWRLVNAHDAVNQLKPPLLNLTALLSNVFPRSSSASDSGSGKVCEQYVLAQALSPLLNSY